MLNMKKGKNYFIYLLIGIVIVFLLNVNLINAQEEAQAMQTIQQIMGLLTQILGNLKTEIQSNMQAEHERLGKVNAPRLPEDRDYQMPNVTEISTTSTYTDISFKGIELTLQDRNNGNKIIAYNRVNTTARLWVNSTVDKEVTSNTTTIISKGGNNLGVVRVGNETTLIDQSGANISQPPAYNQISKLIYLFLPLVSAADVFPAVFESQYVIFQDQSISINGKNILFYPLKPYDRISLDGNNLIIMENGIDIKIDNEKTFYPRQVKESDQFINRIVNVNDNKNFFRLLPGGVKGNYLSDNGKILTMGEEVIQVPVVGYEGINIPKTRLDMWKKV